MVFGYWNTMGFIPKYCLINILYMVGMKEKNNGRIGESYEENAKKKEGEIPH